MVNINGCQANLGARSRTRSSQHEQLAPHKASHHNCEKVQFTAATHLTWIRSWPTPGACTGLANISRTSRVESSEQIAQPTARRRAERCPLVGLERVEDEEMVALADDVVERPLERVRTVLRAVDRNKDVALRHLDQLGN